MNKYGIDKKMFDDWTKHPVTEAYRDFILGQIEDRKAIVAGGGCTLGGKGFSDIGQKYLHQINVITTYESMLEDIEQFDAIIPQEEELDGLREASEEDTGG